MQETIQRIFGQLLDKWKALERRNKTLIILITAVVITAIVATVLILTRPQMESVMQESLSHASAVEVANALTEAGIKNNISSDFSTVYVPKSQITEARKLLITEGIPEEGFTFTDAMSLIGMGTTAETQKMISTELAQSKLERDLKTWKNIKNATVQLTLQDDDTLFRPQSKKPTASISLETTAEFTKSNARVVANHVKSSIAGLDLADVYVTGNGVELFNGATEQDRSGDIDFELERQKKADIIKEVSAHFKMFDDVNVSLYLETNKDYYREQTEEYSTPVADSDRGLIASQTKREQSVTNGTVGDEPGTVPNGADIPEYNVNEEQQSSAESTESDTQYALSKKTTEVEKVPGTIDTDKSTLALTFYKIKTYYEESAEKAGLLEDKTWDQYKNDIEIQIIPLTIDDTVRQDMISIASNASGIKNVTVAAYEKPLFIGKPVMDIPIGSYAAVAVLIGLIALLALGLIRRTEPEEITEFEPELSVEELLVSTQQEPESADSVAGIDYMADSELKKQIDKFVEDNPEAVAQLLRNWLSDEWE